MHIFGFVNATACWCMASECMNVGERTWVDGCILVEEREQLRKMDPNSLGICIQYNV